MASRKRVRTTLEVHFGNAEEKEAFALRLQHVRELLTPGGSALLDNYGLMCALFDAVDLPQFDSVSDSVAPPGAVQSFVRSCGAFSKDFSVHFLWPDVFYFRYVLW